MYFSSIPSVERWYVLSSVVRRFIFFIVSGTSINFPFLYLQWYGDISLHAFSGTLVCVIVSGTAVHLFHCQWYVDELSLLYHQWYGGISLDAFNGTLVCVIVSGTAVHLFHRQWYVDELSLLYHQWYGGISLHAFSGTLVCVIVSGTAVHLFHC